MKLTAATQATAVCRWYMGIAAGGIIVVLAAGALFLSSLCWWGVILTVMVVGWTDRWFLPQWLKHFRVEIDEHRICRQAGVFRQHCKWVQWTAVQAVTVQETLLSGHYHCAIVVVHYTGGRLWLPLLSGEDCRKLRRKAETGK